ncbi:hypothetical protein FE257_005328 [Aspergillus nanangensis]|uniref:Actin-like ATPase domain-containing protein n=1 Tax=Aspergillus nanangensis TaxID=2582783 RepID=A0AAD4CBH4_ASPNN|nr:hypothetical protein FE257_005328 [Aspergillus nanangensis]
METLAHFAGGRPCELGMDEKEAVVSSTMAAWEEERFPDIVVGIDFGMTCTGVAYTIGPEWGPPKTIQRWPGRLLSELANKVPTSLVYGQDGKTLKDWGFGCDEEENPTEVKEFFKLHLAPYNESDVTGAAITRHDARRWFQDYISCIYRHTVKHFDDSIPGFREMRVEFIFSVPTTWKDVRMIEDLRKFMDKAIKRGAPKHWACIGLTEAEAAAVYACRGLYKNRDIILVCDAGGGTTDVNVLRLASTWGEPVQLEQLGNVEGRPIGSVFIDRAIHRHIIERLSKVKDSLLHTPDHVAWKMLSGRFQRLKCAFGTEAARTPTISLPVPFLKSSTSNLSAAEICDGQMIIEWEHVQHAFDIKIDEMLLMAEEPQLAVVHGLVLDRIQQLKRGVVMFGSRCSPVSYGIICDLLYDPEKHIGEPVRRDPRDSNIYAIDQIQWLIVQGASIPHTGISKDFQLKIKPGEEHLPWKVHIVMSTNPPEQLPQSMRGKDVQQVVVGAADLTFQLWSKDQRIRSSQLEPIKVQWMPAVGIEKA